ncbi:3-oxoacyl-[acyl-carrier-protein] synthase II [Humitalea rosea]|uniref:3-oxoacyl-[acyl-carrier-protein] synthase II n=1 Tax=Humitalea rosea TaxID=990373 RepID=A0A2W7IKD5_9PROT|nr:beta-ketoacyl-ACP synthase [Humitalea rosea]PZW38993.1 3-oxoacyl-[acyl-carrier-protein] synthase II [Humitalea rosea]
MTRQRIVITGIGLVTSLGDGAEANWAAMSDPAGAPVLDTTTCAPFALHPVPPLPLDAQIPRKGDQRQMEPWQRLGTYAAGLALDDAGARDLVADMHLIVAAGGGERDLALDEAIVGELAGMPAEAAGPILNERLANGLRPTLFLAQLSNLMAGNISIVHGVTGSSRTFMGEEQAGADALRIAAARLGEGSGRIALVGGAFIATRWDLLIFYGPGGNLMQGDWAPISARGEHGGIALGGMAGFLVLETEAHAEARGARVLAHLDGVATDTARRRAPGESEAALAALWQRLAPMRAEGPLAVISGTTGAGAAHAEERGFLDTIGADAIRTPASRIGHGVEATFFVHVALAALALQRGALPAPLDPADTGDVVPAAVLVTGMGQWRGESLALLSGAAS